MAASPLELRVMHFIKEEKMTELSASKRLHNLCAFLEEQKKNDSPYSAESWNELQTENNRLTTELAILRKERAQLVKIHEACASELYDAKKKISIIARRITAG